MTWMTWIVALVGLLILAGGLLMLTVPNAIRTSLQMFIDRRLMPVAMREGQTALARMPFGA